jgi:hypothetical protein
MPSSWASAAAAPIQAGRRRLRHAAPLGGIAGFLRAHWLLGPSAAAWRLLIRALGAVRLLGGGGWSLWWGSDIPVQPPPPLPTVPRPWLFLDALVVAAS